MTSFANSAIFYTRRLSNCVWYGVVSYWRNIVKNCCTFKFCMPHWVLRRCALV